MIKIATIYLSLFLLIGNIGKSQEWIRIYGDSTTNTNIKKVIEQYDKGYIFIGDKQNAGWTSFGLVMKTDVNGFERWEKSYGNPSSIARLFGISETSNKEVIIIGIYNILDADCSDPLILKLNACGEKEWCKIYDASRCNCGGRDIIALPDGGFMALIDQWTSNPRKLIWLFRLDSIGDVTWSQSYASDSVFAGEWSHSLLLTPDTNVIITAETYYPDQTMPPNIYIKKIILIKVDIDGNVLFEEPWGTNNGIYSDGRLSVVDVKGNIYTAGRRARKTAPLGDSPCLFKTSATGVPVLYKDLKTTSTAGISTTINWFQDSTLSFVSQWHMSSNNIDSTGVIKTDSIGNFIKQTCLSTISELAIWGSDVTFNNKLILGGSLIDSGFLYGSAYKLTSNLEYDSIYTTPFTYDSLCPYPIVSDTIPLDDCEVVVVGIDEARQNPETTKLKVYPNPSDERITIELPKYLVRKSSGQGMTANTIYHQWKEVRLEVFDLHGQLMFCETVPQQKKSITLNVSSWSPGMYVARLVFMNEVVGREKFVIN